MRFIAALLAPIPLFHLWLHGLLEWWRRFPLLLYIWGAMLWLLSIILFVQVIPDSKLFEPAAALKILGWIFILGGWLLAVWSIQTLGLKRFFVWGALRPKSVPHIRESSGPFRFLPHPAYTGYLVMALGILAISGQMFAVGFLIYLLTLTPLAIYLEEKELQARMKR